MFVKIHCRIWNYERKCIITQEDAEFEEKKWNASRNEYVGFSVTNVQTLTQP